MATTQVYRTLGSGAATTKFTYSCWFKRGELGQYETLLRWNGTGDGYIAFQNDDTLDVSGDDSAATSAGFVETNRKFRDPGAWMHLVVRFDSTEGAANDRLRIYINGVNERDAGGYSTDTMPNASADDNINLSGNVHRIGATTAAQYFSGCMSHVHLCIGYSYAPTEFGETDATSGIWKIKTGAAAAYGTNGWYLKMQDSSNMDLDSSPNALTFTTSGDLTPTKDNPSNSWTTWNLNSLVFGSGNVHNGNTRYTRTGDYSYLLSSQGMSKGKWYGEFKCIAGGSNDAGCGIVSTPSLATNNWGGANANNYWWYAGSGAGTPGVYSNGSVVTNGSIGTIADDDIVSIAMDLDNNKVFFGLNGTWLNSSDPVAGTDGITITDAASTNIRNYFFTCGDYGGSTPGSWACNFGNGYFATTVVASAGTSSTNDDSVWEYDCPTGFYGLNTTNIATYG